MVKELFRPGFGLITMSMAQIYAGCGLLPSNHPYLNRQNAGRYGIGQLILEAGRNLKFTREHMDQVFIYMIILGGVFLLFSQIFIAGFIVFTQMAHAMPTNYTGFFVTQNPDEDIAFVLLDRVFGIPAMFDSCVSLQQMPCIRVDGAAEPFPLPYHGALHDMLSFYSVGLLVIAMIIFMYYAVAVMLETAESGTPFGRRFNHVWAPVRMVVALGLLVPLTYGLNGAQILTLYVAKWGSSFATNGWLYFTDTITDPNLTNLIADPNQLTGYVQKSQGASLFQFFTVVSTCKKMYQMREGIDIDAYLVKNDGASTSALLLNNDWQAAVDFYNKGDILVVFGKLDPILYHDEKGSVKPFCGEIALPTVDQTDDGAVTIQQAYYRRYLQDFWANASTGAPALSPGVPALPAPNGKTQDYFFNAADRIIETSWSAFGPGGVPEQYADAQNPNQDAVNGLISQWTADQNQYLIDAVMASINDDWVVDLQRYGWAGAGIWYNKLAEKNGGMYTAVANLPTIRKWPMVMEAVAAEAAKTNQDRSNDEKFTPYSYGDKAIVLPAALGPNRDEYAQVFNAGYKVWNSFTPKEISDDGNSVPPAVTNNALTDFLRDLFGTTGLFSMYQNTNIHPLAQITIMGKNLLETSIRNIAYGTGFTLPAKFLSNVPKQIAAVMGSFLQKIGMMTLSVGFVLYYVVPFMPFLYFFFQVGGWIKGMFEAMVGLPLWALAHIRIDGEGLAGSAALPGYFLILELFLRPILTIFGLVGGIAIFAAQVKVLNEIFALVVTNVTGFDQTGAATIAAGEAGWYGYYRGYVDQLFYTIIYAVIVYMMGTASFKMVYSVPDKTLRWMGASVESFGDEIAQNHPEALVGKMNAGVSAATGQMSKGVGSAMAQMGK